MGQSTTANCQCGYTSQAVFGGPRKAQLDQLMFPHYCEQCGVVNASPYKKHPKCPNCYSSPLHRYGVETSTRPVYILGVRLRFLERTTLAWDKLNTTPIGDVRFQLSEFTLTEGNHRCPECREMTLRFDVTSVTFFD